MTKHFNKIHKHLNLLRDIGDIKLSLLGFSQWSKTDSKTIAIISKSVTDRFYLMATTRGRMAAIDELKASRLAFTRGLCGRPLSGKVGAPVTKNGLPKVIPKEVRIRLQSKDLPLIKDVLTTLNIGRYFKGGKPLDLTSITEPSQPKLPAQSEIIFALKRLGVSTQQQRPTEGRFSGVTTAGPNGPSISASLKDLPRFNELFRPLVEVILPDLLPSMDKILNGEKAFKLSKLMKLDSFKDGSLRKISIKDDREGKSRPFAILDYGSQTTLSPLHDHLYSILRKIPQDCTYDQAKGVAMMNSIQSRKWFYSYDLKSATDRFPVVLQKMVLSLMFDAEYAEAGSELLTREPFRLPGSESGPIKWAAGQPLGAKSSGAVFSLCHHVVVQIAAIRSNERADYVLLGDDIVLRGRALATEYKRIMNALGVEISENKSHVSKDTFEFAKIGSHKGQNASGFPIVGLAETIRKPLELAALMVFEAPRKGYPCIVNPCTVSHFFTPIALGNTCPQRQAVGYADKVCWYFSFLSTLVTKDYGGAKYIAQTAGFVASPDEAHKLFSQTLRDKGAKQLDKTLWDFQDFGFALFERVRELPPFKSMGDPKAGPGRMSATGIEFTSAAKHVPIFAAIQTEGKVVYSDYFQQKLEDRDLELSLEEIGSLRLAPRPQLRGFEPLRAKENIRTLSLISRGFNLDLMAKGHDISVDAHSIRDK